MDVQIHSDDAGGVLRTITLTKTGADRARIDIESTAAPGSVQTYNLKRVTADPASITIVCQLDAFFSGDISVALRPSAADGPPVATITVSHAFLGNGVYVYSLRVGEDALVRNFLQQAAFPPLAAGGA